MGNLFNDIVIHKTDANGNSTSVTRVPLTFASKDKMLARVKEDPNFDKETAISLPRMAYDLVSLDFDGSRKLNPLGRNVRKSSDVNKFKTQYNPVPFNLQYRLYIMVKYAEDAAKIYEQILPYFTPEWNATVNLIPDMSDARDIAIVLKGISKEEDTFEGAMPERRIIIWTLDFELKGFFYGPIKQKPIIKFSNTNFFMGTVADNNDQIDYLQITPGLLANGDGTTNAAASISPLLIDVDDDWLYAVTQQSGFQIDFE